MMTIDHIMEGGGSYWRESQRVERTRRSTADGVLKTDQGPSQSDGIEISEAGKDLLSEGSILDRIREEMLRADEGVRSDKVQQVIRRIREGYYERSEIIEEIVRRFMESDGYGLEET